MNSNRPLILHISSDYEDGLGKFGAHRNRRPTVAVNNLVEGATEFDHVVFSLRRRPLPFGLFLKDLGIPQRENVRVFSYGHYGLPLGIGLFHSFWLVARRIRKVIQQRGLRPNAVHAHRLTFDGIAGWLLARWLDLPLFISVRGEVERKVFKFKPYYRLLMRRIVADASCIFLVSAWYAAELQKYTQVHTARKQLLPNFVSGVCLPQSQRPLRPSERFLTVANLEIWRKKGLDRLLPAFADALAEIPELRLEIIGAGSQRSEAEVRDLIGQLGITKEVRMVGAIPNAELRARMATSLGLVLPSHNETFGTVYVEALFAGVPILYSKGTGIDGFIDGLDVGIGVDPNSVREICQGLITLAQRRAEFCEAINDSAHTITLRFGREQILDRYQSILRVALSNAVRKNALNLPALGAAD